MGGTISKWVGLGCVSEVGEVAKLESQPVGEQASGTPARFQVAQGNDRVSKVPKEQRVQLQNTEQGWMIRGS